MTRDDILRMAREAGLQPYYDAQEPAIERFFKLAYEAGAAAERDRMISEGWRQCAKGQRTTQFCGMVEQEREACARVCDDLAKPDIYTNYYRIAAAAIRARGQQRPEPTYPSDPIWREQKRLEMEAWARNKLARHGIQIPEDEDGNPSF